MESGTFEVTVEYYKKYILYIIYYIFCFKLKKFATNNTFFRAGGPACIVIGGESPMDPRWIVFGQMVNYCQQLNGVIYMLEHRFYGESTPTP